MSLWNHITFQYNDLSIHEIAAGLLLSKAKSEFTLTQNKYAYKVDYESLYYKKENYPGWILVANWCFYGAYMVVRYRKPIWLRPMYESLFKEMNFIHVSFGDSSIELLDTNGNFMRSRSFRLSPPGSYSKVLSEKFNFSADKIEELKKNKVFGFNVL